MSKIRAMLVFGILFSFSVILCAEDVPLTQGSFKKAAEIASPSIVRINVKLNAVFNPTAPPAEQSNEVSGSGIIMDGEGHILTNRHVVEGSIKKMFITLASGEKYPASLVGKAPDTDLAVIKAVVPADKLKPIVFREMSSVGTGEFVVAIGSPMGLDNTVTHGIVSAIRVIPGAPHTMIQTDAAINHGNSGGGLLDLQGQIIGINTMIISSSGSSAGLGFSIPADVGKTIYDQIRAGRTELGWLGVMFQKADDDLIRMFNLPEDTHGFIISKTVPGAPAALAGLRQGDCIEQVGNKPIRDAVSFAWLVRNEAIGSMLRLSVRRGKAAPTEISVKVGVRPALPQ